MLNVKKKECEVYLLHIFVIQTFNNLHILFFLHLTFYSQRVANNVETNLSFWNEIKLVYVENNNKSFAKNLVLYLYISTSFTTVHQGREPIFSRFARQSFSRFWMLPLSTKIAILFY